jgi:hypothetical protein
MMLSQFHPLSILKTYLPKIYCNVVLSILDIATNLPDELYGTALWQLSHTLKLGYISAMYSCSMFGSNPGSKKLTFEDTRAVADRNNKLSGL